jgi:catechol 2,3-dioxygenase-like lactoylglutathione lyase family enzyme
MNLNQITVPVRDVPSSIKFYQKLGLKLIVHTHDAYARFECPAGDATFSLHKVEAESSQPQSSGAPNSAIWVYFEIPDVDVKVSELEGAGIVIDESPEDKAWLWREARLYDPDGNVIILYRAGQNRKNPPWRLEEGA